MNYTRQTFDLQSLYQQLFGYRGLPFPAGDVLNSLTPNSPLSAINAIANQFKQNELGKQIIVPLTLKDPDAVEGWTLPIEVMIRLQGKQKVIKRYTHYLGSKGSIKEQWGLDDYQIEIKGAFFVIQTADSIPLDSQISSDISMLNSYFEKGLVSVSCPLLNLFSITHMFIEEVNYPFNHTGLEVVPFVMRGVSDFRFDEILTATCN